MSLLIFDIISTVGTKDSVGGVAIGIFRVAYRAIKNASDVGTGPGQISAAQSTDP